MEPYCKVLVVFKSPLMNLTFCSSFGKNREAEPLYEWFSDAHTDLSEWICKLA